MMAKVYRFLPAVLVCLIVLIVTLSTPGTASRADETAEAMAGAQLFEQLKSQGEIVKSSPLYVVLRPIASAITKVVIS